MNLKLIGMIIKSVIRRRKNVRRVVVASILSFIFITGILLLQENLYNWQIVKAKEYFGDWFVMDIKYSDKENDTLKTHPYLDDAMVVEVYNEAYDVDGNRSGIFLGTMSQTFAQKNNIRLDKGNWPKEADEIAVDWGTLYRIKQSYDIGENITLTLQDSKDKSGYSEKTFKIVGILSSYTDSWANGNDLPGIIVNENATDIIKYSRVKRILCYPLKSFIKENDYRKIYDGICETEKASAVGYYNSHVYDVKPWGNANLFNYMYILIMAIGVFAISYQIMMYDKSRNESKLIHKNLGATKLQMFLMYLVENVFVILISGLIGVFLAIIVGKIICDSIIREGSIEFFALGYSTIVKLLLAFLISIAIGGFVYLISNKKRSSTVTNRLRNIKTIINRKNITFATSNRFRKNNGFVINTFIRLFALIMAVVIIICTISVNNAYKAYNSNNQLVDLVGYNCSGEGTFYIHHYYYTRETDEEFKQKLFNTQMGDIITISPNLKIYDINDIITDFDIYKETALYDIPPYDSENIYRRDMQLLDKVKYGKSNAFDGINDKIQSELNSMNGIANINYGYYETERSWYWEGMDLEKLGADEYSSWKYYPTFTKPYYEQGDKYLFATEYLDVNEDVEDLITDIFGNGSIDLNAFADGKESILFVDTNTKGQIDDTIKEGTTINLYNYYSGIIEFTGQGDNSYSKKLRDYVFKNNMLSNLPPISQRILKEISKIVDTYYYDDYIKAHTDIPISDFYDMAKKEYYQIPAATTKAAKVIVVNDDIKQKLKDYIPEFGQYTMLASSKLAQTACDHQNELMRKIFFLDELPDEIKLKLEPNQVSITYSLSSAFTDTNHIVESKLRQAGLECKSFSLEKDLVKQRTLESIIFYGFSGIAALIIYLLVNMIVVSNNFEKNRYSLTTMKYCGAENKLLTIICIIECLRENIWCFIAFPISIIIDWLMIRKRVAKL